MSKTERLFLVAGVVIGVLWWVNRRTRAADPYATPHPGVYDGYPSTRPPKLILV